ncbi:hypothetical protein TCAL_07651 [Tigriopus californicus]|uniref:Sodium/calcium exchanger membrane region domain-containing protein n=2 Tax=Tigriopus californicus TaxID=6832 RepID=A0A553NNE4_TIGCA|nr:hypothetical protein TCAL_07651 [Tigriopus californicus]
MERPFLRDVIFYLGAGFWAFWIFYSGKIHLYEALGFLGLYLVYIVVVLVGRLVHHRQRRSESLLRANHLFEDSSESSSNSNLNIFIPNETLIEDPPVTEDDELENQDDSEIPNTEILARPNPSPSLSNIEDPHEPQEPYMKFYKAFLPMDMGLLRSGEVSIVRKIWEVVRSPVVFLLNLTVPVVNDDLEDGSWCQHMAIIQCLIAPQFVIFAVSVAFTPIFQSVNLWELMIMIGQALAIFILCTSSPNYPPRYHALLAYVGFGVSVIWIYLIANEIVSLLKTVGVLFGLSDAILGLTVLAWGNSIGDLITNTSMAKQGYPRMGYSACFGGPLFNLLLGIGIPFTKALIQNGNRPISLEFNPMVMVLSASLGVALLTSFVMMPLSKFRASRTHGFVLIGLYLALLTAAIFVEFKVTY